MTAFLQYPSDVASDEQRTQRPDRFQAPTDWPYRPFEEAWLDRPAFAIFRDVAAAHPDAVALHDGTQSYTYAQCLRIATALAGVIAERVPDAQPFGIALANDALFPIAMLAGMGTARPYVPIDIDLPDTQIEQIVRYSGMRAVIVDEARRERLQRIASSLPQIDILAASTSETAIPLPVSDTSDCVAYMVYTSGSTGQPKGVYHTQRGMLHSVSQFIDGLRISERDRLAQVIAPTVGRAALNIFSALLTGATLHVVDLKRQGLQHIHRVVQEHGITVIDTVPAVFRKLFSFGAAAGSFDSVRIMAIGGDRYFAADAALFRRHFPRGSLLCAQFGSTEGLKLCHWFIDHETKIDPGILPIGYPLPDRHISLRDEHDNEVDPGGVGEIVVTSRYIARGYWNAPELSAATFATSPEDASVRLFRTGDLGRFLPDGKLEFLGRQDRLLKVRGNRVEPAEIEAAIRAHPDMVEAAVIGRRLEDDAAVIAYAIPRPGATVAPPLKVWLAEQLPAAKQPQEVHLVDTLPMLPNFKPDLRELEAIDRARAAPTAQAPSAPRVVHQAPDDPDWVDPAKMAWCRLLPGGSWDENQTWEASGGDSLKGLELVMHLELLLKRRLPVAILLRDTTPRQLVANIRRVLAGDDLAMAAKDGAGRRPVVFLLPGAAGPLAGQVEFVRLLANQFDVRILDYPSLDPVAPRIVPIEEALAKITADLERDAPDGPLRLLGYSYGGYVAVELARRFALSGRQIEFLGVIDSPPLPRSGIEGAGIDYPDRHVEQLFVGLWQSLPKRIVFTVVHLYLKLAYWLVLRGSLKTLARLVQVIGSLGFARAQLFLWWHATHMSRRASLLDYLPEKYPGKMWLFRVADDPNRPLPEDYGWRRYCRELTVDRIEGVHETVFSAGHVIVLSTAVRSALETSPRAPSVGGIDTGVH